MADIELVPDGPDVLAPRTCDGDYVAHTNHFLSARLAPDEQYLPRLPGTTPCYCRMEGACT